MKLYEAHMKLYEAHMKLYEAGPKQGLNSHSPIGGDVGSVIAGLKRGFVRGWWVPAV